MRSRNRSEAGFTLLEILVVVVVISILASIGIISLLGALDRAKQRATIADMRTISRALEAYNVDNSRLPDDSGGLAALTDDLIPHASNVVPLSDHWGNTYVYDADDSGNYSLISLGKDGVDGADLALGENFNYDGDIVVWNGIFVAIP